MNNTTLLDLRDASDAEDPPAPIIANTTFINEIWLMKPWSTIIIESTIFLPVVLFGIFGNIISIYILLKNRHIRTPTNLLIGNMAAADLLSLLIHPWVFLVYDSFQNYQLGNFGCKTEAAVECSILIASVISLSAISYDRLTAIVLPKDSKLTKNGAKIAMVITWVVGFLVSSPLFIYRSYKERQWKNFLEKFCVENTLIINTYWHVIITVMVWLPLSIQLVCYITIFIKLRKYEKVVQKKLEHHQVHYKKKVVRMMFAVIFTFMVCRLPFTALIFYRYHLLETAMLSKIADEVQNSVNGFYHTFWFVSKFLIFVNAALNPLIYSVTNEKFRRGFKTTNLSKWLFAPQKVRRDIPKNPQKTQDTTFFKNNIFFIFKRKQKISSAQTNETTVLPKSNLKRINIVD